MIVKTCKRSTGRDLGWALGPLEKVEMRCSARDLKNRTRASSILFLCNHGDATCNSKPTTVRHTICIIYWVLPLRKRLWNNCRVHLVPHFEECSSGTTVQIVSSFFGEIHRTFFPIFKCCWFELGIKGGQSHKATSCFSMTKRRKLATRNQKKLYMKNAQNTRMILSHLCKSKFCNQIWTQDYLVSAVRQ